ncbi:benzoate/H(+) symporter BenE family transporter [Legionella sp. MW5194]|uniref:benzoate/H(+) symporter BenE family transporter n=1 Tax=Legionella sp. MW5194 TaxID=2662448 RepID=UPI00193DA6D6|nr:benzoate/H(+) symporter BenE family transporter [Legionella sp. MW5194]QRN02639.1 benzoate/H(+) symporter BenE family transporter [Legionella sp. MW5194]
MLKYFSISHAAAGFIAVMVGFTSSAAIVFQAAAAAGADKAEISSWLLALGLGTSLSTMGLSFYYRMPVLTAWSTPGAVLLMTSLAGLSLPQAVAAFMVTGLLTLIAGLSGYFEKVMDYIPRDLVAAMLAGVLLHFGLNVFTSWQDDPGLVTALLASYLLGKRFFPRYVMVGVLAVGLLFAYCQGLFTHTLIQHGLTRPVWVEPEWSWPLLFSVSLPLFIVTMTSQNIPGIAVLHAEGYRPPVSALISLTGLTNVLFAPFGGFSCNLAAITAAICAGKEAGRDPDLRYLASLWAGVFYLLMGLFAAAMVDVLASFPKVLITTIAGLALFATISSNLQAAFTDAHRREAALLTLMISTSGITILGMGAAFWGLAAGIVANGLQKKPLRAMTTHGE